MAEKKKFKFDFQINPEACMACAACEYDCRDNAIYVDDNANYAINQDNCSHCSRCFRACPADAVLKIMIA